MNKRKPRIPVLPDTSKWQPREDAASTLHVAFRQRCNAAESVIGLKVQHEQQMNIDNYDSGMGVEDIVRDELRNILPTRYAVHAGVINDRQGRTAGDYDVIVYNDLWFPAVKPRAASESRRSHFPIEGVYAVLEIKQTLDYRSFDDAMEKLITCHRLHRPRTHANRLVENRDHDACFHGLTNPLYSCILATGIKDVITLDELVNRFYDINKTVKRLDVVRALCVLGHGTVTWAFWDDNGELRPARFMREDLFHPIFPIYHRKPAHSSALYALMVDLMLHLYHSVLAPEDIAPSYGAGTEGWSIPKDPQIALEPDAEWLAALDLEYDDEQNIVPRVTRDGPSRSQIQLDRIAAIRQLRCPLE